MTGVAQSTVRNVVLGTAGHIDHGKSSLVKAMTGTDPDRLKEEKERGITIDLGFANLAYPDNLTVGIVDVPGHERLIKNMLAGAGGIDIVLMVIAADEGVMPQSREHLAICELLKIKAGIVAITKTDLVDEDWLALVIDDVRGFVSGTFLDGAEIIPVSARTGDGVDMLKEKIHDIAMTVKPKLVNSLFRLPIDRVFTLRGFGTVVTGTALSGTISLEDPVEILPSGYTSKVRGLQSHGAAVDRAVAGQRIGVNLQGIEKALLKRGDVVVTPGRFVPTKAIDAKLDMLSDAPVVKSRSLVHFYSGTAETIARIIIYDADDVKAGGSCFCQFRLEEPIVVLSGDRYIIRRFSPLETIGGGQILDPQPARRRKQSGIADLVLFDEGNPIDKIETKIRMSAYQGRTCSDIEGWVQGDRQEIRSALDTLAGKGKIVKAQDVFFHGDVFSAFREALKSLLLSFHKANPLKTGMPKEEAKAKLKAERKIDDGAFVLLPLIKDVVVDKEVLRHGEFRVSLSKGDEDLKAKIVDLLGKEAFQPSTKKELQERFSMGEKEVNDLLRLLSKEGTLVRIQDSLYITKEHYDRLISLLKGFFSRKPEMTVAEFRDLLDTSRKYALPFLEYLDSNRITLRVGDVRKFMLK
ncbi:MAG TPA: selenocysteine-specific translation elongation factor [Dissulfurispiraceae bacterium]|nr:selenocysteine-specific translation elongation factor [Dissulfurispiraceae bacterium]